VTPYEYKLPVSGEAVRWVPLKVGQQIDIQMLYSGTQVPYQAPSLLAARIVSIGAKTGASLSDVRDWDENDYAALWEEVEEKEAERARLVRKKDAPELVLQKLQRAILDAKEATAKALRQLDQSLEAAAAAVAASGRAGDSPLG